MTAHSIGAGFAALLLLGVVLKVFLDRHMTVAEGTVIAVFFGAWGYMQLHGRPGNSGLLLFIGFVLLALAYRRNAAVYGQRVHDQLDVMRARKPRRHG
jgi:hypothetical protein